jgi:hypothetical protein
MSKCLGNCPCGEAKGWRSQNISLTRLEEVEIVNFRGLDHEMDFVRLIFGCAPMLTRMIIRLPYRFIQSEIGKRGVGESTRGGEEARGWGRPDDAGWELPARRGAAAPAELNRERIRSGRGEPKLALGFRGGILFCPSDGSSD